MPGIGATFLTPASDNRKCPFKGLSLRYGTFVRLPLAWMSTEDIVVSDILEAAALEAVDECGTSDGKASSLKGLSDSVSHQEEPLTSFSKGKSSRALDRSLIECRMCTG